MDEAYQVKPNPGVGAVGLPQGQATEEATATTVGLDDFVLSVNRTQREYPLDLLVHELFEQQAERTPDALAVLFEHQGLTFRQLNERANQLAHFLRRQGVGPDAIVGVCMLRSLEMEIALLAILKAGGAYVPLDPDFPQDRLSLILQKAASRVVLTQESLVPKLAGCSAEVFCVDREQALLATFPSANVGKVAQLGHLAYVIFTSGSTGVPKGVMIEHGALLNRLWWMQETFPLGPDDRVLQKTPYTFDVSVWEFFWPMMVGVPLVFAKPGGHKDPGYLIDLIGRAQITTLHFVPSMLEVFLQHPEASSCRGLRRVLCSGEALGHPLRKEFFDLLPSVELHNLYGPTEAAIDVSWWDCRQSLERPVVPIGRPIANTQLYILDGQSSPVPVGVPGELHIGGVQLARGYLRSPELTAERFVVNPFDPTGKTRLYKTGDLCRYLSEGSIEFLGREDDQVKIRGVRIELGEIEAVLSGHGSVGQAVVIARQDRPGEKRLVGYVVMRPGQGASGSELREYLSQCLPEYMVPSAIVVMDSLPLTVSGKVDRRALPAPSWDQGEGRAPYASPETPVQEALCGIFGEVLGVEKVGIHDNFFELGGHSLLATKAVYRLQAQLGVDLSVQSLFENPTAVKLSEVVERKSREEEVCHGGEVIARIPGDGPQSTSFAQQRMWFLYEIESVKPLYNLPFALTLRGPLRLQALEESVNDLLSRHDALRTTFDVREGEPVQIVHPHVARRLEVESLEGPLGEGPGWVGEHPAIKREACIPFDLRQGPLIRMKLFRVSEQEHVLVLTMHHIVSDGWSMDVLFGELSRAYSARVEGRQPELEPLAVRYVDYAVWQREWLEGPVLKDLQEYWRGQLKGELPVLELPADRVRSSTPSFNGRCESRRLGKVLSESIKRLSRNEGKTLFMTLLGGFEVLLHRMTGQEDIIVGSPIANRTRQELEPLIGFFVNTLALRCDLSGNPTFEEVLTRIEQVCLEAYAHQDLPFEQLVDQLHPMREPGRNPLFEVVFVLAKAHGPKMHLPELEVECETVPTDTAKFDLTLFMEERAEELVAIAEYRSDLFSAESVSRLLERYERVLEWMVREPRTAISDVVLLSDAERQEIVEQWNGREGSYPSDRCVHELFDEQASRTPEAEAIVYQEDVLTYRQLQQRANQLAHYLRKEGLAPDGLVGVYLERSPDLIVTLLAILKAGGSYVPLDCGDPGHRLSWMLEDTGLQVVVTRQALSSAVAGKVRRVISLDGERERIGQEPMDSGPGAVGAEDRAYVMYTSGSTGRPKGVEIPHRGIVRLVSGVDYVDLGGKQSFLQLAPVSFDASTFEIWGSLLHGHRCVLYPDEVLELEKLGEVLATYRIDCLWLTASLFNMVIEERPQILKGVRQLLTGGEALSVPHVRRALEQLPQTQLINGYGPTESTTFACSYRVPRHVDERARSIPIGRPMGHTQVYILDDRMRVVPVGVAGELYIGGAGLARGYWRRPELTSERFVINPFDPTGKTRLYKTGDLCRYLPEGNIEFLGRMDHQVKIRGFRIEMGEIETVLSGHESVGQCVVVAREDRPGEKRLVGYVVARSGTGCSTGELREYLGQRLPEYMVPSAVVVMESLPLTVSGKVDRRALPAPCWEAGEGRPGYEAPQTPVQEALCGVFCEVLGVEKVGIHDDFFELGGHSLLATKAVYRIHDRLRTDLQIQSLFEHPTAARLAQVIERLPQGQTSGAPDLVATTGGPGPWPLSYAQQRMWFLYELEPQSALYNISYVLRLRGRLEVGRLEEALDDLIGRHSSLRTTFETQASGPVQLVQAHVHRPLSVEVLDGAALDRPEGLADHPAIKQEASIPFDLRRGPVLRAKLFRMGAQEHALVLTMHHIVSDGWSMEVLFDELSRAYGARVRGEEACLEPLTIRYSDYAVWQRQWFTGQTRQTQLSYWQGQLKPPRALLDMPTDYPHPAVATYQGQRESLALNAALTRKINEFSRDEGKTLFMTLLAGFEVLLHRVTGQEDIVVGSPIANRTRKELEPLVGLFVNTLALRCDVSGNPTFRQVLDRVERVCLGAYAHQDLPFEQLVDQMHPTREPGRNPLFQVMFVLAKAYGPKIHLADLEVECLEVPTDTAKFDLMLFMEERGDELVASAEYRSDLFTAESIGRLLEQYERVLESMVREPQRSIGEVSLLSEAEWSQIVETWNQTEGQSPVNRCVHEVFDEQAARTGESEALVYRDEVLTYRQVQVRANQLSHYLQRQGLGPDRIVGVYLERGPDLIIALLAILKAGGCYVPLDCGDPQERLSWMVEDTGLEVVITQQSLAGALAGKVSRVICLDRERVQIEQESIESPVCSTGAEDRAYVMYTSGSAGRPKGVEISHRGIVRLVCGVDYVDLGGKQSFLQLAPVSFDASTFEIWGALLHGHRCIVYPESALQLGRLGEVLKQYRVDCLWLTASLFNMIVEERPEILRGVRQLLTGGEALSVQHVRRALEQLPHTQLINGYGPTESTTFTCTYRIGRNIEERARSIPIGRPISHTQVYILDDRMQVVPVGVAGQLYIGGAGLARGYWRRPELTAERFVVNPFDGTGKTRLYKSGDVCRYLSDGNIEFLGRVDDQVKIRGFRIEPGEIESALAGHDTVGQCVVAVRQDRPGEKRLVGYVVARPGQKCDGDELAEHLARRLPEYMVPSAIVVMDSLPLTVNGKVDRRSLPAPSRGPSEGKSRYVSAQTPVQESLCRIFAEVLGVERVGIHDDFFELGGHSLLAVRLLQRIEQEFHKSLPLATLFRGKTVAELCDLVVTPQKDIAYSPIACLRSGGTGAPLFILPGAGGHAMAFSALAVRMDLDSPVYALELQGLDGKRQPHRTIEDMASHFIDLVQAVQRQGPYYLAGYSFGGRVAFEMALQLAQRGESVGMLAMIAATAPGCPRTSRYRGIDGLLRTLDFLQLPHAEKLEYLRFKVWKTRDKSRHRRAEQASASRAPASRGSLDANIKAVTRSAFRAWARYRPKTRYSGDLLVVRDTNIDSPLYRSIIGLQAGWDRYVTGTVHIHEVPSGHLEILKEPYVGILARGISDYVRRQRGDPAPSSPFEPAHAGPVDESSTVDVDRSACTGWPAAPALPSPPEGELHVFVADLDMRPNLLAYYSAFLSPGERDRATRFVQVRDRDRYIARHGLLRELLSRYTSLRPERVELHYSESGKPSLRSRQNPCHLRFSVTSREGLALYAFTCKDDIGIDLERTRPIENLLDMAALQLPAAEVECIRSQAEPLRLEMFYTIWTCKEAYIKARGIVPLKQFTLSLGPGGAPEVSADEIDPRQIGQWSFSTLAVGPGWHAALAVRKGDRSLKCWRLER